MIGEAGDKANAAASKIIRFYRKASTLFRRSTAFRNEANAGVHGRYGIRPLVDVGDPTIDGASNGKAGARLVFKLPTAALTAGRRQNQPRT